MILKSKCPLMYKHHWCSGNIVAFQAIALGSIPGWCSVSPFYARRADINFFIDDDRCCC